MTAFIIHNMAPIMFAALVVFLLLGYPVAFALAANGLVFGLIGIELGLFRPDFLQALPEHAREDVRRSLGALHALRLALMQHMFLKAVQIPAFSRSNDISRDDVLEMVFTLRIDDALAQLRRAFPVSAPSIDDFAVDEATDYPDGDGQAYAGIQSAYITPIEQAYALCLRIGTAIANHFGAHG